MILHVDMDAFYASVEERDQPDLRGKPVIVGGSPDRRGVVAAANYVVRRFGVHSAMPTATALRRCPQAVVVRPRMDRYSTVSRQIHEIFQRYTPLVEPLSLDEAFLDVSGSRELFGDAAGIGRQIKSNILRELQLVASVGVAPNKFLAKLASDLDKPDGFVMVPVDDIASFLDPLPIGRIWGVGKVTEERMIGLGVGTIGQLRRLSRDRLQREFGRSGEHFWKLARGIDDRRVVTDREAKSISNETTFATDIEDMNVLRTRLLELTEHVARRLRGHGLCGRVVQIKLRYSDFHTVTRSQSLPVATASTTKLWNVATELLEKEVAKRRPLLRLLGMGISGLGPAADKQLELFAAQEEDNRLDEVSDQIQQRFGSRSLRRGMTVENQSERT